MNKHLAVTLYLALWVAFSAIVIYGMYHAGLPLWASLGTAYFLFVFLNGTLAYRFRVKQLRSMGKEAPPYLKYIFLPKGAKTFKDKAPRSTHIITAIAAALMGAFFMFCGVALSVDAEWSHIKQPLIAASLCLGLIAIGAFFLYLAWRIFSSRETENDTA